MSWQDYSSRPPPGWSQQDHAARPPPGWTRTPLYAELCALKQQVASLTDEKIQLRGCVTDLRETVGRLGAEMSKMKRAFGALSNLVDAEVESCRGETSKLWVEATQAKESRVVTNQALERVEQSVAQQRSHDAVRAQASAEWIERAVAQVEELREDADRRWQHWVEDARERMRAAELLRASVVEGASETQGLGQSQRELALQMERLQEALAAQARVDGEIREQAGEAVRAVRADLGAAAKEEAERAQREAQAARARERSLENKLENIVAETQGAFNTLGGQLRDVGEEGEALREAHKALSGRVAEAEETDQEAARRLEELQRALHDVQAQAREQREAGFELRAATQSGVKELEASIHRVERELRALQQAGVHHHAGAPSVLSCAASAPRSPVKAPAAPVRSLSSRSLLHHDYPAPPSSPMSVRKA